MSIPFRYRKLGYVALNVTDIERSTAFYTDIVGLDLSERVAGGPATCAAAPTITTWCSTRRSSLASSGWRSNSRAVPNSSMRASIWRASVSRCRTSARERPCSSRATGCASSSRTRA